MGWSGDVTAMGHAAERGECRAGGETNQVVVPPAGIEPARLTALDFESSASTNSATEAQEQGRMLAHRLQE